MPPAHRSPNPTDTTPVKSARATADSPRKVPRCTKCKRPRAGHPKQGCPFDGEEEEKEKTVAKPTWPPVRHHTKPRSLSALRNDEAEISGALESLQLAVEPPKTPRAAKDTGGEKKKKRLSVPARPAGPYPSIASLDTVSKEVVNRLSLPGIMANEDESDEETKRAERVARWQETMANPRKSRTPATPSPKKKAIRVSSPFVPTSTGTDRIRKTFKAEDLIEPHQEEILLMAPKSQQVRSMSDGERGAFLDGLFRASSVPPATVFVLPLADIPAVQAAATKQGFYTQVVEQARVSKGADDGLLILGTNEHAVKNLKEGIENQSIKETGRKGRLSAAAGGAVVGAVATWTGLAFA